MNARTEEINGKIGLLEGAVQDGSKPLLTAFSEYNQLTSELWWAEQGEKIDNAKQAVLDNLKSAKDWTVQQWQQISTDVSNWFQEKKEQMAKAWGDFKEYAGQKFENFKEAMQQFGEKIAEMWGKAMESLGKMLDEIKISAHNFAVDAKAMIQNLGTDMYYGVANLGVAMQKGVLAMDDAFQTVKGTVSQAVSDKFGKDAGQLLVDSELATQNIIDTGKKFTAMDFDGQDPKTVASAQAYQEQVLNKMQQEQEKLTQKMQSRESLRDSFQNIKDATQQKMQANQSTRSDLNAKARANTGRRQATKQERTDQASQKKSSYADKVRSSRSSQSGSRGM